MNKHGLCRTYSSDSSNSLSLWNIIVILHIFKKISFLYEKILSTPFMPTLRFIGLDPKIALHRRSTISLLLKALVILSCGTSETLNSKIESLVLDGSLEKSDWEVLTQEITLYPRKYAGEGVFVGGALDSGLLCEKITALCPECQCPPTLSSTTNSRESCAYHVFIENSGSMRGYVNGSTHFADALCNLTSDIRYTFNLTSELNSYLLGREPIKSEAGCFEMLETRNFGAPTSDIASMVERIVNSGEFDGVQIFVSDFIFSPGSEDARDECIKQRIVIRESFSRILNQNLDLEILFVKLKSSFNGWYYDFNDKGQQLDAERPYYMMVMGPKYCMRPFMNHVNLASIVGYQDHHYFFIQEGVKVNYRITSYDRGGSRVSPCRSSPTNCVSLSRPASRGEAEGQYQFSIAADFSSLLWNEPNLASPTNYSLSQDFELVNISKIETGIKERDPGMIEYTHLLTLRTRKSSAGPLKVSFKNESADWIEASSTMDDRRQEGAQLNKTFGLSCLLNGVQEAFQARYRSDNLFELTIEVKN